MDADQVLALINDELLLNGFPSLVLTVEQSQRSFAALKVYAVQTGRPLDVAARDVARFQIQTINLGRQS